MTGKSFSGLFGTAVGENELEEIKKHSKEPKRMKRARKKVETICQYML